MLDVRQSRLILARAVPMLTILFKLTTQDQQMERTVKYFRVSKDFIFKGQRISTAEVRSLISCADHCLARPGCSGMNVQTNRPAWSGTVLCEVLSLADDLSDVVLLPQIGWSAYRLGTTTHWPSASVVDKVNGVGMTTDAVTTEMATDSVIPSGGTTLQLHSLTTTAGFVDTNPEYCTIDGAFVYRNQIYLVSGQAVYTFSDVTKLSNGPIKTYGLSHVIPGISAPIDAIFTDETESNLHVIQGDVVRTYTTPSAELTWTQTSVGNVASFLGESYGVIADAFVFSGETVVIFGKKVATVGGKSAVIHSNSPHNFLGATNKNSAPADITAAAPLNVNFILVVASNQAHSFSKPVGASKGTWGTLSNVKCRV